MASLTRAKVEVMDNQVEAALKTLKKAMIKGGLYQEMKRRVYYEKPSVKRKQAQARKKRRRALKRSRVDDEE
jgi:small subunit ribosomal protein S21